MTEKEKFLNDLKTGVRYVVINKCYGGFGLSNLAVKEYASLSGITDEEFYDRDVARDDPYLIKVIKDLGSRADGDHSNLKIVEIPADVDWEINEYDGMEWVAEKHRTWS